MTDDEFGAALVAHHARLLRVAARLLADPEDARDAVQETYLHAWRDRERASAHPALGGYLTATCRNCCYDALRLRRRRPAVSLATVIAQVPGWGPVTLGETLADPAAGPPERALAGERDATVWAAIGGLRPPFRAAVALRVGDDLDYRGIAARLGVGLGTAQSRLGRGYAALRRDLAGA